MIVILESELVLYQGHPTAGFQIVIVQQPSQNSSFIVTCMHLCLKTGYRGVAAEATMAATVRMPLSIQSNLVVTNLL